ncbi:alpha/beta fold hydrolase [Candidatus Collierbacteria bacterium]|nr:alpha/beta fold hydrolase [Candidatus Collierbacteria bacterium]
MEQPARVINIVTPKKFILNGLWFGSESPSKIIIFIHGLGGNAFSSHKLITPLANNQTAVITFSNRGHDQISSTKKVDNRKKKGYSRITAGESMEIFTDCVDDIQGAVNYALSVNQKALIYLSGHSTGCQKSVYYLSRFGKQKFIKGVILLAPMSDYASILKSDKNGNLKTAENFAGNLVKKNQPQSLLPPEIWPDMVSAQRLLSLATPESREEIFCYAVSGKIPDIFRKIKIPALIVLAQKDEYRDRPINKIAAWFEGNSKLEKLSINIIPFAPHNFYRFEDQVLNLIKKFI